MKKTITVLLFAFFLQSAAHAQMTFSGIFDSTLSLSAGDAFSIGIEEYANIRFQSRLRESGTFYGAVNLIAAAGSYAENAALMASMVTPPPAGFSTTAYIAGENYIAGIELERLYFRLNFEKTDLDMGLFRLPFGYGQVWGPSDFLNPKNPLKPDARPRGILGTALSWFPKDDLKLLFFAAAPRDPFLSDGKGWLAGLSLDQHWNKASLQALYSYETPQDEDAAAGRASSKYGIHRAGLSVKADVVVSFVLDALYTYNHEARTGIDGLSFSIGADYSFFDGNLIIMAEYLYNGKTSSTASDPILGMPDRHYLYTSFTWRFNDFTNLNIGLNSCLEKISFTPMITLNHEIFQGVSLMIMTLAPIDSNVIDNGKFTIDLSARLRLRF